MRRLGTLGDHIEIDVGLAAGVSDRGRRRRRNEDAVFVERVEDSVALVVCDGVATGPDGDIAARLGAQAAGAVLAAAAGSSERAPLLDVRRAIGAAQRAVEGIAGVGLTRDDRAACTLVCALCVGTRITVGWVGDSRAYWFGPDETRMITNDDVMGRTGAITRWIGADAPDEPPHVVAFGAEAPGRLVLCSDGLWRYANAAVDFDDVLRNGELAAETSIQLARRLVAWANEMGGDDNITAAVGDVDTRDGGRT